jgi:UDP-N-acetyl-2-amino-2-deoxyglucuronate dehydrogenase
MSTSYRVALIGCGKRARIHMPALTKEQRANIVAVSDINPEATASIKADYELDAAEYSDHRAMLKEAKPDVIITCLWTPLHLAVFRDCVEAGVRAVHSEKPMAPSWAECQAMAELAEKSSCQLTFCHQRRFAAGNLAIRKMISQGRIGKLQRMDLYAPPNLLDCGTHTFDQAMSFNDESPAQWVLGAVDASEPIQWFDVHAEAMAAGIIHFSNGVRANFQVGGPDKDMGTGLRVIGEKGFFEAYWDGQFGRMVVYDEPDWQPEEPEEDKEGTMERTVSDIFDAMEEGREPELSWHKAVRATEIIFALYESVRRHARIELPLSGVSDNPFIAQLEAGHFGQVM